VLPHDQSHDIQISVKNVSETAKKCHLAAETGSSSILNVCAKAILFSNTLIQEAGTQPFGFLHASRSFHSSVPSSGCCTKNIEVSTAI